MSTALLSEERLLPHSRQKMEDFYILDVVFLGQVERKEGL